MYGFLNEKDLLSGDSGNSFPSFSQSKHNLLCSELKQLYVAITRTRQRLWICENDVEVSKPMLDYWRKLSLVQVKKVDDSLAEAMKRASTPKEWKSQGIKVSTLPFFIYCFFLHHSVLVYLSVFFLLSFYFLVLALLGEEL